MSEPNRPPGAGKKPPRKILVAGAVAAAALGGILLLRSRGGGSSAGTTFSAPPTYSGDVNVPNYSASLAAIQDDLARLTAEEQQGRGHHHGPVRHERHGHKHGDPDRNRKRRRHPGQDRTRRRHSSRPDTQAAPAHLRPHRLPAGTQAPRRRNR